MAHYTDKTHIFRDENDNRVVVVTSMLGPDDSYEAELIETTGGALELLQLRGFGDTRMAAIADLNDKIAAEGRAA
jgi:hypothetical protein